MVEPVSGLWLSFGSLGVIRAPNMDSTQPTKQSVENKPRPIAITIVCIALFAGLILSFLQEIADSGDWLLSLRAMCGYVVILAMIGLWNMRRWAVYTYTGLFILVQVKLIALDHYWDASVISMQCVVILIMFAYLKRMR
jgi:hypothetical protein